MTPTIANLYTIGVYDSDEDSFFEALTSAGITVFCDIRARRGLRGHQYAYANSAYLQDKLEQLGIQYRHFKDLAPSEATRQQQAHYDKQHNTSQRQRTLLSNQFKDAYHKEVLDEFDVSDFLKQFEPEDKIVLFCVERQPTACHRSLLAQKIADEANIDLRHLLP